MDFATFKQAAQILPNDISVILRGKHGIGKSEIIRQLANDFNLPIIERRLSQLTEGDLLGLPKINGKTTKFLPPDWYAEAMEKPCVLFLDEFDRAINEVQQAAMELILERSIQGKKIHKECRIYSAINGGKHGSVYKVNNIDPALNDRFWIADIEPSIEEWIAWGRQGRVIDPILDFIQTHNQHLETDKPPQDTHKITPSRRSWTRLSNTLEAHSHIYKNISNHNNLFIALCSGFVGLEATGLFKEFIKNNEFHITAKDILDDFDLNEEKIKKFKVEHLNLAIDKLAQDTLDPNQPVWTKEQANNVFKFFEILSSELKMVMWDKITYNGAKIENAQIMGKLVSDIIINILGSG